MSVLRRDSDNWLAGLAVDSEDVIGDSEDVLGDSEDNAALLLKLLFGDPIQQLISSASVTATVKRRVRVTAEVSS